MKNSRPIIEINTDNVIEIIQKITENRECDYIINKNHDKNYSKVLIDYRNKTNKAYGYLYTDYIDEYNVYLPVFDRKNLLNGLILPVNGLYKWEVIKYCGIPNVEYKDMWYYDWHLNISKQFLFYHIPSNLYHYTANSINKEEYKIIHEKHQKNS